MLGNGGLEGVTGSTPPFFKRIDTEDGVTIVDFSKLPGYVLRYGKNTVPGTTDITTAAQNAIDVMNVDGGDVFITGIMAVGELTIKSNVTIRSDPNERGTLKRLAAARILDTNGVIVDNVSFVGIDIDQDNDFAETAFQLTPGSTDILFDDVEFKNFDNGSSSVACITTGSSATVLTSRITIKNCRFFGNTAGSPVTNYQTLTLANVENITIDNNQFDSCGSINWTYGSSFSGAARNIRVINNNYKNIDSTPNLLRPAESGVIDNILFSNNEFQDISPTNDKACINVGESASAAGGTLRNIVISNNTCKMRNSNASGIKVGSSNGPIILMENVSISANTIVGRDSSDAIDATKNGFGIQVQNDVEGFTVTGNNIEGTSGRGIVIIDARVGTIAGNTLRNCLRQTTNTDFGGIALSAGPACNDINIVGNTLEDCGNLASQAPIRIAAIAAITRVFISGNHIRDSRTPICNFAINVGNSSSDVRMGVNFINASEFITGVSINAAPAYTVTNGSTVRSFDANDAAGAISAAPTQAEVENIRDAVLVLADVVGTTIADAKNISTFQ